MKTRSILNLFFACSLLVLATACDVKDPIFNTAHPGHGTVTLTTDWSTIGTGLTAPESYTVTATRDGGLHRHADRRHQSPRPSLRVGHVPILCI